MTVPPDLVMGLLGSADGVTWNAVDGARVKRFMDKVETLRCP